MTSTTWPGVVDSFPSAATLETSGRTLANLDGLGLEHSDWMERVGQAIRAIETTLDTQVPNATGVAATDNAAFSNAVLDCIANGTYRVVFGEGEYNLTAQCPALPTGGSFSAGTVKGVRFSGLGKSATTLKFSPATSIALFIAGGNVSQAAGHFEWDRLTIKFGNTNADVAIHLKDPVAYCTLRDVDFVAHTVGVGTAIRMTGQVNANSDHQFDHCNFYGFAEAIRFSGFANSNTVTDCWFGQCGYGIRSEAIAPDTQGGQTNTVDGRCEFNGGVGVAVALRGASQFWDVSGVNCDGPTTSLNITSSSDFNTFIGCLLPVVTLAGTALETTVFLGCQWSTNGTIDTRPEVRIGGARLFWHATNDQLIVGDNSNDGAGAAGLVVHGQVYAWDAVRLRDSADTDRWIFAIGQLATNSLGIGRPSATAVINIKTNDELYIGTASTGLGFFTTSGAVGKQTLSGSRGGNAAMASIATALANLGLATDSTTA